jgi:hypothetical protein
MSPATRKGPTRATERRPLPPSPLPPRGKLRTSHKRWPPMMQHDDDGDEWESGSCRSPHQHTHTPMTVMNRVISAFHAAHHSVHIFFLTFFS